MCKVGATRALNPSYVTGPRSFSSVFCFFFVSFAALAAPATGLAQSRDAEQTAIARALFQEGVAFADRGQWAQAADRFERTLALRYSPAVAFNLAAAQIHLGRYVAASELLRRILRDETTSANVRAAARSRQRTIAPRIGRLTVVAEGLTPDVEIRLDGAPLSRARLGVAAPEDPGEHRVEAVRNGQVVATNTTTVPAGGGSELRIEIPVIPAATSQAPSPVEVARADVASPTMHEEMEVGPTRPSPLDAPPQDDEPALTERWWFWAGISAVVIAGTITAVVIANSGDDDIVEGDFMPGVVEL